MGEADSGLLSDEETAAQPTRDAATTTGSELPPELVAEIAKTGSQGEEAWKKGPAGQRFQRCSARWSGHDDGLDAAEGRVLWLGRWASRTTHCWMNTSQA